MGEAIKGATARTAFLVVTLLLGSREAASDTDDELAQVLDRVYRGKTLRAVLTPSAEAQQKPHSNATRRYALNAVIAFRSALGEKGGLWLSRAVVAGVPAEKEMALFLLDMDLDAALHAAEFLKAWLKKEPNGETRYWISRVLVEAGDVSADSTAPFRQALKSGDWKAVDAILIHLWALGPSVDLFAEELLDVVESIRPEPPREGIDLGKWEPRPADVRDECLVLLARAGARADGIVPRLARLLRTDKAHQREILRAIDRRGKEASEAADAVIDLAKANEPDIREAVARILGRIDAPPEREQVISTLRRLERDRDRKVREEAARSLRKVLGGRG